MPDVHLQPKTGRQFFAVAVSHRGAIDASRWGEWRTVSEYSWLRWQLKRVDDQAIVYFEADTDSSDISCDCVVEFDERIFDPLVDDFPASDESSRAPAPKLQSTFLHIKKWIDGFLGKEEDFADERDPLWPISSQPTADIGMEKLSIRFNDSVRTVHATLVVDFGNTQSAAVVVVGPGETAGMHQVRFKLGRMPNSLLPRLSNNRIQIHSDVIQPSCVLFTSAVARDIGRINTAIGNEARAHLEIESASRHIPMSSYCYVPKRYLVYDQEGQWTDWNEPFNPVRLPEGVPEISSIAGFFLLRFFQRIQEQLNGAQAYPHEFRIEIESVYLTYPLAFSKMERDELLRWSRNAAEKALGCKRDRVLLGVDEATAAETFFFFLQLDILGSNFELLQRSFRISSIGDLEAHHGYPAPPEKGLRILTFDCGGGTTDITLADVTWQKIGALHRTVHAYDTFFVGGDDLTRSIIVDLVDRIEVRTGISATHFYTDLEEPDPEIQTRNRIMFTHLLHLANQIKYEYSKPDAGPEKTLTINFQDAAKYLKNRNLLAKRGDNGWSLDTEGRFICMGKSESVQYSFKEYESLFDSRRNPLLSVVDRGCALTRETRADLILLTGMTCRTPFIKKMLVERTHLPASSVISLDRMETCDWKPLASEDRTGQVDKLAVALGAACRCASEYYGYVPSVVSESESRVGVQVGRFQQNRIPGPIMAPCWIPPGTSSSNPASVELEIVNQNMLILGFRYARQAQAGNGAFAQPFTKIVTANNQTATGILTLKFTHSTQFEIESFRPRISSGARSVRDWIVKYISYSWDDYFLVTGRYWEDR